MLEALKATMASQTAAYCAIIDGVMNPMTLHHTRKETALLALEIKSGITILALCSDPECDCTVNALARRYPDVKIVPVDVTERKA